jgi:TatD DNase family protein
MLVDSHCHLDYYVEAEIADVIARAQEAGIGRMVTIGTRFAQAEQVKALTERFDCVWGTVGIHPHNAGEGPLPGPEALAALADHPRIIGLGESGLDYFYDKAPRDAQAENFRNHIRAAQITWPAARHPCPPGG